MEQPATSTPGVCCRASGSGASMKLGVLSMVVVLIVLAGCRPIDDGGFSAAPGDGTRPGQPSAPFVDGPETSAAEGDFETLDAWMARHAGNDDTPLIPDSWPAQLILGLAPTAVTEASPHLRQLEQLLSAELGIAVTTRISGSATAVAADLAAGRSDIAVVGLIDLMLTQPEVAARVVAPDDDALEPATTTTHLTIMHQGVRRSAVAEPLMWIAGDDQVWCADEAVVITVRGDEFWVCPELVDAVTALAATSTPGDLDPVVPRDPRLPTPSTAVNRQLPAGVEVVIEGSTIARQRYAWHHVANATPAEPLAGPDVVTVPSRQQLLRELAAQPARLGIARWAAAHTTAADGDRPLVVVGTAGSVPHEVVAAREGLPADLVAKIVAAWSAVADMPWGAQALLDVTAIEGWIPPDATVVAVAQQVAVEGTP